MLRNRVYLEQTVHESKSYQGLHPPIIDQEPFDAMQGVLARKQRGERIRYSSRAPLPDFGMMRSATGWRQRMLTLSLIHISEPTRPY